MNRIAKITITCASIALLGCGNNQIEFAGSAPSGVRPDGGGQQPIDILYRCATGEQRIKLENATRLVSVLVASLTCDRKWYNRTFVTSGQQHVLQVHDTTLKVFSERYAPIIPSSRLDNPDPNLTGQIIDQPPFIDRVNHFDTCRLNEGIQGCTGMLAPLSESIIGALRHSSSNRVSFFHLNWRVASLSNWSASGACITARINGVGTILARRHEGVISWQSTPTTFCTITGNLTLAPQSHQHTDAESTVDLGGNDARQNGPDGGLPLSDADGSVQDTEANTQEDGATLGNEGDGEAGPGQPTDCGNPTPSDASTMPASDCSCS